MLRNFTVADGLGTAIAFTIIWNTHLEIVKSVSKNPLYAKLTYSITDASNGITTTILNTKIYSQTSNYKRAAALPKKTLAVGKEKFSQWKMIVSHNVTGECQNC